MLVSLNQYHATMEIFNNCTFICASKCKNLFLVRHSQNFRLIDCAPHCSGEKFMFVLTSKYNARSDAKFFCASILHYNSDERMDYNMAIPDFDFTKWRRPAQSSTQRNIKQHLFNMPLEFKQHMFIAMPKFYS